MTQPNRLANGGRIDRGQPIQFSFDNQSYSGYAGDTLASALLANDVKVVSRSFKYHRPRGVYTAGSEEPNALVQLETGAHTLPDTRATEIELYEGLSASSQNRWPSLKHDVGIVNNALSRFFPAGFYNKTFMYPKRLWMKYEEVIRHSAGLGKSPTEWDPDHYDHQMAYCDVLVIGGGPTGLSAALAAGLSGARVMLLDEQNEWGGSLLSDDCSIGGMPATQWVQHTIEALSLLPDVKLLSRTSVTGYYDHNYLVANERKTNHLKLNATAKYNSGGVRERLWKIRAKQVILATGAIERPLVFADNDRPGIMLAGAMRSYIKRYGVLPAKEIAVITNNDSAYHTALDAANAGASVRVIDIRKDIPDGTRQAAEQAGITLHSDSVISGVRYQKGQITGIQIAGLNRQASAILGAGKDYSTGAIAVSGGWNPMLNLYSQAKGKLIFNEERHCFLPDYERDFVPCPAVGASNGEYNLTTCLANGHQQGIAAAKSSGADVSRVPAAASSEAQQWLCDDSMRPLWILPCDHPIGQGGKKHFHELHNDSTVADLALAHREGFESVEHLKRYTTTGMGTDQGKTSNVNALLVLADLRQQTIPEVGTTTFRPPYTALTFGAIVGQNVRETFLPKRTTPMEPWHQQNGAVYEDVGDWKRPHYFPVGAESMHEAVQRECKGVREGVGMLDATTLGKIDIQGKDAAKLLNMVYTNAWSKLGIGQCRYGLMLNEHGMIFDDGVTTRLGDNHFHMTTTTGGAARVMNWLEEWTQTEWPDLDVYCTSVTEQWAVMALNGPKARDLLSELTDLDLSNDAFPFMTMQEATIAGVPARLYRISFTGELAFEINVPARYGLHVWESLMKAGEPYGLFAYGTESMHVLRAEKGFIIVGQDTDGTMTPMDAGMDWIVSKVKKNFLGKRSFSRSDTAREGRKQIVGLLTDDPQFVLPEGAHAVSAIKEKPPMSMIGHVTSSYMSPNVGRSIAMAAIANGLQRMGETIDIALMDGNHQKATICSPVFFDEKGERSRG